MVAELYPRLRNARSRTRQGSAARNVAVAARALRLLNRRAQIGQERVAALDERQRFLPRRRVVPILAHGAEILLPGGGYRPPQPNDAWLHRLFLWPGKISPLPLGPAVKSSTHAGEGAIFRAAYLKLPAVPFDPPIQSPPKTQTSVRRPRVEADRGAGGTLRGPTAPHLP